jgi:hypothetical protein
MFEGKSDSEVQTMCFELIQKENDRGSALLAAVLAENILQQLLSARLLLPCGQEKLLDGFNSPIGTFSSKIELTYRLGIIPKGLADLLNGLRKIRNIFAHETIADFETPSVASKTESAFQTNPIHYEDFINNWSADINKVFVEHGVEHVVNAKTIKLRVRFNNYFAHAIMTLNAIQRINTRITPIFQI